MQDTQETHSNSAYQSFLTRNQLDNSYLEYAKQWFLPLIDTLLHSVNKRDSNKPLDSKKPLIVGINGCQGSGKSTLADYLRTSLIHSHNISAVSLSLDDFYLKKSERVQLAKTVHPLLETRGVPGTHDTQLAMYTLEQLAQSASKEVLVPVFDKTMDDRSDTPHPINLPVHIIILEGWCIGATAQSEQQLNNAINSLEREQDSDGRWRHIVNDALCTKYAALFSLIDCMVMLKAPSFECVLQWRIEQEQKMASTLKASGDNMQQRHVMNDTEIQQFIAYYQRITEHCLATMPSNVHHLYELDSNRAIRNYTQPLAIHTS